MNDLTQILKDELLGKDNKKIESLSLEKFLTSHKTKNLVKMCLTSLIVNYETDELEKINTYFNKPKKEIINYINNNIEDILYGYLLMFDDTELEQLKLVINKNQKKLYFSKEKITIGFLNFIKEKALGNVEYIKDEDYVKVFMPKEYIKVFKNGLNDEYLLEKNRHIQQISRFINLMINAYGVITARKLHELFEKIMYEIDFEELMEIVIINLAHTENCFYCNYKNDELIYGIDFDTAEDAIEFYKKQEGEYKIFSLDDYEALFDVSYMYTLKSYDKLIDYLTEKYELSDDDIDYINDFFIADYITCSQTKPSLAIENFKFKFKEQFDSDYKTINELLILLKNLYNEYPKWSKKGNI